MKGRLYLRSYAHADNKSFGDLSITILKCFDFNVYKQANVNIASIPWVGRAITAKTMTIVISDFSRTIHIQIIFYDSLKLHVAPVATLYKPMQKHTFANISNRL